MGRFRDGIRANVRRWFVADTGDARRSRADLRDELDAHVQARIEFLVAHGYTPESARAEAVARFGGDIDTALTSLEASAIERDRRLALSDRMHDLWRDARFVARGLRRSPAFTAGLVATLALGLGINSAVFRIADRLLLREPDGVADPRGIRRINTVSPRAHNTPLELSTLSYPDVQLVLGSRAFVRAGAYVPARAPHLADGREIPAAYVDSGFFATLGVRAAVGRLFDPSEAEPGAERYVTVVSHDYWIRELGGAPINTVQSLVLNGKSYTVVGVTPAGFTGIDLDPVEVWFPLGVADLGHGYQNGTTIPWYRSSFLRAVSVIGRVPSGAGNAVDASVASRAGAALGGDAFTGSQARTVALRPLTTQRLVFGVEGNRVLVGRLAVVALVVLLVACANAANLLLARALRRRREIAVRIALGARRSHVMRLLLVESVMLGVAGGLAAGLGGYWSGDALRRLLFPNAHWSTALFDDRVLFATLSAALIVGVAAGLAPAAQLAQVDVLSSLKDVRHRAGRQGNVTRMALVVLQTAFSLILMIDSALLVRSLEKLNAVNIGFSSDGLVTASVPTGTFRGAISDPTAAPIERTTANAVAERMRHAPGVTGVALASTIPFGAHSSTTVRVPGQPDPDVPAGNGPYYIAVSPSYFNVMGTRVIRGRGFSASDDRGRDPVVVVGETMARYFWPNSDPLTSCLLANGSCARVVGIVEDIRDTRGGGVAPIRFYFPLAQDPDSAGAVIVRTAPERAAATAATLRSLIPAPQRPQIDVVSDIVNAALRPWKLAGALFALLGVVALVLACVGVYSVMSYMASERIHELGVRVVLGATPRDIVGLVVGGGMRLLAGGMLVGLVGAAASARLFSALLFGVSPLDPAAYLGAVLLLGTVGVVAALVPALRVMHTDPTVALRSE